MRVADANAAIRYYDDAASSFAPRYDSVRFEEVHSALEPFLPRQSAKILDIGAGSGRDARALARLGHYVTAVEPSDAFRRHAVGQDFGVRWVDDRLPTLTTVLGEGERYDFILCSAVLMVLGSDELRSSFATMAALLTAEGRVAVSVRDPIAGEPAAIFHRHLPNSIIAAAGGAGLHLLDQRTLPDALGRDPHRWRSFVFEKRVTDQPPGPVSGDARKIS